MSFDFLLPLLITHGYVVVFIAIALECAALPIPGELLLLALGGIAFQGHLDPTIGVLVAALAVVVGDSLSYWVGRVGGERLLTRVGITRRWKPGALAIIFGRFVVGARVAVAPMAGTSGVAFTRFLYLDAMGALIWAALFVLVGYGAGANLATLERHWTTVTSAVGVVVAIALVAWLASKVTAFITRLGLADPDPEGAS